MNYFLIKKVNKKLIHTQSFNRSTDLDQSYLIFFFLLIKSEF